MDAACLLPLDAVPRSFIYYCCSVCSFFMPSATFLEELVKRGVAFSLEHVTANWAPIRNDETVSTFLKRFNNIIHLSYTPGEGWVCSCRTFLTCCTCKHELMILLEHGKEQPLRFMAEYATAQAKNTTLKANRHGHAGAPQRKMPPGMYCIQRAQLSGTPFLLLCLPCPTYLSSSCFACLLDVQS